MKNVPVNRNYRVVGSSDVKEGHAYMISDEWNKLTWTVSEWLVRDDISNLERFSYSNAKIAAELMQSPLCKALT